MKDSFTAQYRYKLSRLGRDEMAQEIASVSADTEAVSAKVLAIQKQLEAL